MALFSPLNYMPLFPSPFFTLSVFPKCPPDIELTVLIEFCKYFLQYYPKYKTLYTNFHDEKAKQLLLEFGFQYYARDIVFYTK